jgi:adenylate cyclase class 2
MQEIETKILAVDIKNIQSKMDELKAEKVLETRLTVDWFGPKGMKPEDHEWYLRVRTTSEGKSEMTLKNLPTIVGNTRHSKEISFTVSDGEKAKELLSTLGLENYAHQEKDRISWKYKDWSFDLDQYPNMPAYLEIEGQSHEHVQEAIKLLELESYKSIGEGERVLINKEYGLNWFDMRF